MSFSQRPCVTAATSGSSIGGCSSTDVKCICSNPTFLASIACCLAASCSVADQQKAVAFAQNFCAISGVTNLPSSVSCSTSATATATGSGGNGTVATNAASATSSSASSTSTAKSGAQKVVGMGAGVLGSLAMGAALL